MLSSIQVRQVVLTVTEAQRVFVQIKFDNVNHNGQMTVDLVLSDTVLTCHGDIITGNMQ